MHERGVIHTSSVPDLVVSTIAENPNAQSLLDIGSGKGRLLTRLYETKPDLKVAAIEVDQELVAGLKAEFPGLDVIAEDFRQARIERRFDVVAAINTIHEICNAPLEEERSDQLQAFVRKAASLMVPGGSLIIYDGIMPVERNRKVVLSPLTEAGRISLAFFEETYKAKPVSFVQNTEGDYEATLEDLTIFLTKFAYLNHGDWKGESKQLYPFLPQSKILEILAQSGYDIKLLSHPVVRKGLTSFLKHYSVEGLETFPPTQVFIEASFSPNQST